MVERRSSASVFPFFALRVQLDGRNLRCSSSTAIGSCQSTATSYDCKARLVMAIAAYVAIRIQPLPFVYFKAWCWDLNCTS